MENEPPITPSSINNSIRRTSSTDKKPKKSSLTNSGRRVTTGAPGTPMFHSSVMSPQVSNNDPTTVHRSITSEGYGNNSSRRSVTSGQTPVRRISTTQADGSKRKVTSMENNNNNNNNGSRRSSSTGNNNNNISGSRRQSSSGKRTSTAGGGIRRVSSASNRSAVGGAGGWNKRTSTSGRPDIDPRQQQQQEVFEMPERKYDGFTTQPPLKPGEKSKRVYLLYYFY